MGNICCQERREEKPKKINHLNETGKIDLAKYKNIKIEKPNEYKEKEVVTRIRKNMAKRLQTLDKKDIERLKKRGKDKSPNKKAASTNIKPKEPTADEMGVLLKSKSSFRQDSFKQKGKPKRKQTHHFSAIQDNVYSSSARAVIKDASYNFTIK
jgi:hypothetical protein